ncbi:hypothetical protein [Verrucomicrobium sp. BvORR034]|uniref:hypothetical protein n=1 Tax=Verrucomicrobium sp. BvORR034 TaxID=1396418 RepID=UPI000679489F|nr:hypothetical protein [Verrucomicrobium sp. BvORR034]
MALAEIQTTPLRTPAHVALMKVFLDLAVSMRDAGADRTTARAALDFEEEFERRLAEAASPQG